PGLEGVIAGETAISSLVGGLRYRGYVVTELVEKTSFEEVAYLLLHGDLPHRAELREFQHRVSQAQQLPQTLEHLLGSIPDATLPMAVLCSSVSVLAHFDPDVQDNSPAATRRKAERLLGQIPLVIATFHPLSRGEPLSPPRPELGFAANFLSM